MKVTAGLIILLAICIGADLAQFIMFIFAFAFGSISAGMGTIIIGSLGFLVNFVIVTLVTIARFLFIRGARSSRVMNITTFIIENTPFANVFIPMLTINTARLFFQSSDAGEAK